MSESNNTKDEEEGREQIDAGDYIDELYARDLLPDTLYKRMAPEKNRGEMRPKNKFDDNLQYYIKQSLNNSDIYASEAGYIHSEDAVVVRAELLSKNHIENDEDMTDLLAWNNKWKVFFDCPFCNEKHVHAAEPEVVLGGAAVYESNCSIDFAPDTYVITLKYDGNFLPYKLIHWARDEIQLDNEPFCEAVLPDNISKNKMEDVLPFGWKFNNNNPYDTIT